MSVDTRVTGCLLCGTAPGDRPVLGGTLRRCRGCGLRWTARAGARPDVLHDRDYFTGGGYEDYFLSRPRRFEAGRRLRWLRSTVRPTTLLEAGPAGGYFLEAATTAGITATGIDVSATATRFAREHLRQNVHHGYFETLAPHHHADTVCAFHVLEHVEDPRTFLHAARTALPPGGWLALEVPNIASAAAGRLGTRWPALQPEYHRWHFTPGTLTRLLTRCGFDTVRRDTTVFRYYMPRWYRLRHLRHLLPGDWAATGSPRLTHPYLGDLLRVIARVPTDDRRTP